METEKIGKTHKKGVVPIFHVKKRTILAIAGCVWISNKPLNKCEVSKIFVRKMHLETSNFTSSAATLLP